VIRSRQTGLADSGLTQISRAVRSISEHDNEPFRVEDLARSCGISTSAFYRTFQAVTALSRNAFASAWAPAVVAESVAGGHTLAVGVR
jgi:methylphosphotriester-DNA--protein-cysteine methyltransferase